MAEDTVSLVIKADSSSVRGATSDLNKFSASGNKSTLAMKALLPAITAVISVRAFAGMAKGAADLGSALGEVSTLLKDFKEMPRIEQEAKNLAATFGGTAQTQAEAFYSAISAGAKNAEEATNLVTAANKLAIGGATELQGAVAGLSGIMNAFGVAASGASDVSDALFIAMKAGQTTVGELTSSVGQVSAIAKSAGLSFEEMLAAVSAVTGQGIQTSAAVTGLKAAISNILKPTKEATELSEELGLQFNFAGLKSKGLTGFLAEMIEKTDGSEEAIVSLFGSVEAMNTVFALAVDGGAKFNEIMEDMDEKAGATDTAFQRMASTINTRMDIVQGSISNTKDEVGNLFIALSVPLLTFIENNIGAFNDGIIELTNTIYTFVQTEQFTDWVFALGQAFEALIAIIALKFLVAIGTTFLAAVGTATTAMGALSGVVGLLGGPWIAAALAITGVVTALNLLVDTPIERFTKKLEDATAAGIDPLIEHIDELYEQQNRLFKQMEDNLSSPDFLIDKDKTEALTRELDLVTGAIVTAEFQLAGMKAGLEDVADASEDTVTELSSLVNNGLTPVEEEVQSVTEEVETLTGVAATLDNTVGILRNQQLNPLELDFHDLATTMEDETKPAFRVVTEEMEKTTEELEAHAAAVENAKVKQQIMNNMIENVQKSFGDLFFDLLDGKSSFKDFFDSVVTGFKRMIAELAAQSLMNAIFGSGGISGFLNTIRSGMGQVWAAITGGAGGSAATSAVTAAATSGAGAAAGSAAAGGTAATGGGVAGAMTAMTTGVSNFVGNLTGGMIGTQGGAGVMANIGGWMNYALTNPITLAIAAAAAIAHMMDSSGTMSHNAGFFTDDTHLGIYDSRTGDVFDIGAFDSGAQFFGFTRRADQATAMNIIDTFRALDSTMTAIVRATGLSVNLSGKDFIGYDEKGFGTGAFFGSAREDDGASGTPLPTQLDKYAERWWTLVAGQNSIDPSALTSILAGGSAEGMMANALAIMEGGTGGFRSTSAGSGASGHRGFSGDGVGVSGFASGLERVPYDGFMAMLHEGERVQSRAAVESSNFMASEMMGMRSNMTEMLFVIAKTNAKIARIEDRWDKDGLPPTRS